MTKAPSPESTQDWARGSLRLIAIGFTLELPPAEAAYQCLAMMAALFVRYPESMYVLADRAGFTASEFDDPSNEVFPKLKALFPEAM